MSDYDEIDRLNAERRRRELDQEEHMVDEVRRLAGELIAAAGPRGWGWGNGLGGWVLDVVKEAATEAGLPLGEPSGLSGRSSAKAKIPSTLRRLVMERDAYRCVTCGTHLDLTIDHIHPESKGGPTSEDNLQTMCGPCNYRKGVS